MPVARFQMPDGRIGRFEVPEGTTPERAQTLIEEHLKPIGTGEDVAKSAGSGLVKYALTAPLWAADTINAVAQGVTRLGGAAYEGLGGELTVEQAKALTEFKPLYGSQEIVIDPLKKAGVEFYEPRTTAGRATDVVASIASPTAISKAASNPQRVVSGIKSLMADTASQSIPSITKSAATTLSIPKKLTPEMQKIFDRLKKDFPDPVEFQQKLTKYFTTKGQSLVEAGGKNTAMLAESAAQRPQAAAAAETFFDSAVGKSADRIKGSLSKNISTKTNYYDEVDDVLKVGRAKAAPQYSGAFKGNESIDSPLINKVLKSPEGKSALSEAVKDMGNEFLKVSKPDKYLTQVAKEVEALGLGKPVGEVGKGLKLQTLDYVKRGFDNSIRVAKRAGNDPEVARLTNAKNLLVSELDRLDKTGLYAKARATSGDYLSSRQAMDDGLKFLNDDSQLVIRNYGKMTPSQKEAYKVGVQQSVRSIIDRRVSADGGNYNPAKILNGIGMKDKLKTVLSPKEFSSLERDIDAVNKIFTLRQQIVRNSRTNIRRMMEQDFDSAGQQLVSDIAERGFVGTARKNVIDFMARQFDGLNDKSAKEVADLLFSTDMKTKYQIVKSLSIRANQSANTPAKSQAVAKLGAFFNMTDKLNQGKNFSVPSSTAAGIPTAAPAIVNGTQSKEPARIAPQKRSDVNNEDNMVNDSLLKTITQAEGERDKVYKDTVGKRTIGIGFNMDSPNARVVWKNANVKTNFDDALNGKAKITKDEIQSLLRTTYETAEKDARDLVPNFDKHPESIQNALVEMSFQLGKPTLSQFKRTLNAVKKKQYKLAAKFLGESKYDKQTPGRVDRIQNIFLTA